MNSFLGRCPACEQLVSLPAEARDREVACPGCQHRARGVDFGAIAAPQAVIVLPETPAAQSSRTPRRPERRAAAPQEVAADEAQTHLVLDLPCEEDDDPDATAEDAKTLLLDRMPPMPARAPARRARAQEEERTHLLLDSAALIEEEESDTSDQARTRVRLDRPDVVGIEDATHLQLGPLSVRTGDHVPLSWLVARSSRLVAALLRLSVGLEEALHGRESWVLSAIALACGLIAPGLDAAATGSTLGGFTLLFELSALALLGLAQLNGLRDDAGKWDPRVAVNRLRAAVRSSIEGFEQFVGSPRYLQWDLASRALMLIGLAGLCWAAFLDAFWWLLGLSSGFSSLPFLNGLILLGAVLAGRRAQQLAPTPRFSLHELGNSVAAAAALPPLVDLSDPLPEAIAGGTTALHQTLSALARWQPQEWPDEAAYRAALARHLQRQLPGLQVERERRLGRSRMDGIIDIAVDGMIVIGVQRGVEASAAQRALGQMRRVARAWSGKPMILAIFAAPGAAAIETSTAGAWIDLRKECALLSVRMPTY